MESVKERLMRYVDEHKQELFDTLCELVIYFKYQRAIVLFLCCRVKKKHRRHP